MTRERTDASFAGGMGDDIRVDRLMSMTQAQLDDNIQHTWVSNPKFAGLYYDDADPLLGAHRAAGATFTVQAQPVRRRFLGLPRFVTVRGGAYFFLPGHRALRYLAGLRQ
jgi:hypothetical protein